MQVMNVRQVAHVSGQLGVHNPYVWSQPLPLQAAGHATPQLLLLQCLCEWAAIVDTECAVYDVGASCMTCSAARRWGGQSSLDCPDAGCTRCHIVWCDTWDREGPRVWLLGLLRSSS